MYIIYSVNSFFEYIDQEQSITDISATFFLVGPLIRWYTIP